MSITGQATVTTAGTAVSIEAGGTSEADLIEIEAKSGNSGVIYVGDSSVTSSNGRELAAGSSCIMVPPGGQIRSIYVDSAENGDGITWSVVEPYQRRV